MAFCTQCGRKIREGASFCTSCGALVRKTTAVGATGKRIDESGAKSQPVRSESVDAVRSASAKTGLDFQTKGRAAHEELSTKSDPLRDFEKEAEQERESMAFEAATSGISSDRVTDKSDKAIYVETDTTVVSSELSSDLASEDGTKSSSLENSAPKRASVEGPEPKVEHPLIQNMKASLEGMRFSFKQLEWQNSTEARTTLLTGSVSEIQWTIHPKLSVQAKLTNKVPESLRFDIGLAESRPVYDWKNPFANVNLSVPADNPELAKKIRREGRVVEKLSRLKGEVITKIQGQIISLTTNADVGNLRPTLEALKELAWLIDITLR